jgi:hypothetical protein
MSEEREEEGGEGGWRLLRRREGIVLPGRTSICGRGRESWCGLLLRLIDKGPHSLIYNTHPAHSYT